MADPSNSDLTLSRKQALAALGTIGGAAVLAHCSASASVVPAKTAATATPTAAATSAATVSPTPSATPGVNATPTAIATATPTATTAACSETPEGEIGPYFADDSAAGFKRSNILSNVDGSDTQAGVPLTLNLYVVDTEKSCAAYAGAQVDIWHCNAVGVYSDISSENTSADTYLRGYQITNSSGYVQFTTIVPGWYQGRTTHIHLRVRSSYSETSSTSDGTNTTQLFFPQTVVDHLSQNVAPYNTEGVDSTTNANDHVYTPETEGKTLLTLSGDYTNGFTATFTIGLPIGG